MTILRPLYHLALADFLERTRRYRFLLILGATIYLGVLVVSGTAFFGLQTGDRNPLSPVYRGALNSAWIGTMTVMVTNAFLGLFGFYLVNDCIERDIRTGVGQIIATTPASRSAYLVGKWISNFAVLLVLQLILAAAAVVMVLLMSDAALEPGALLLPFFAVGLPWMALAAAFAVVFETVPPLRGAVGNVLYFFLWLLLFITALLGYLRLPVLGDPFGFSVFGPSLFAGGGASFPGVTFAGMTVQIDVFHDKVFRVFDWSGLAWTPVIVARQWLWTVVGLGLVLLSATWFARFDPSRERPRRVRGRRKDADEGEPAEPRGKARRIPLPDLSPLVSKLAQDSPFLGVLFAELRLLLKGRWWWWLVLAGLSISFFVSPFPVVKDYLLPFLWLLPLPVWSAMGNRERKSNTWQMVYASPRPVLRQLPAAWLAGVLATVVFGIGGPVVLAMHADISALAGWAVAVVFVPTLALALGVVSSGGRIFEVVYTIWWFIGPMQKTQGLDFLTGAPQVYLPAAAGLLLLATLWRSRQVRT